MLAGSTGDTLNYTQKILAALAFAASSVYTLPAQTLGGCAMFPSNNVWNTPVDTLPVDANSAAYVATIGATKGLHPDFSSAVYGGIQYIAVSGTQPKVPIVFNPPSESDPGPYPVPASAPVEGGSDLSNTGDRHVLVLDNGNCVLYELFAAYLQPDGSWTAGSGAIFDLKSNLLRPWGWTSADAAGFAILPGLVRYDEVASGVMNHAIRMTVPQTRNVAIWPARHRASLLTGSQYPPMGQRFRLKASFDITPYPADVRVILTAMKKYGMLLADNGSSWYLTGAPDPRWNDDTLHQLGLVLGSNVEAVDESSLMVDPDSAAVSGTLVLSAVQLNPTTVLGGASSSLNQVVLSGPAPAAGVTVSLSSSNPAVASVPPSVLAPAGTASVAFAIRTSAVASSTPVTISAFYLGLTKTATLTVAPAAQVALASFAVSPSSLTGGAAATGSVTLTGAAPLGGVVVTVASSDGTTAPVPATVTVPAGATAASFTISTKSVTAAKSVTFTAAYGGTIRMASLTVNPVLQTTYTLQAPSTATAGGTMVVKWTAPAGHATNDFVALYSNSRRYWAAATGTATSGSFTVPVPDKQGQYYFRYVSGNGVTVLAQTPIITVVTVKGH